MNKLYTFHCAICLRPAYARVTSNDMRLAKGVHWELRCKKHTPKKLRDIIIASNAYAIARGKTTPELEAWAREGTLQVNAGRR